MINYFYELVDLKNSLERDRRVFDRLDGTKLFELLTHEKEFILDIFKDYWNNDSEMNQLEWFLEYLEEECSVGHNLGKYFWRKHKNNKYLEKTPADKFGKCAGCINFVKTDSDLKKGNCEAKSGYITQNALVKLYCQDYET